MFVYLPFIRGVGKVTVLFRYIFRLNLNCAQFKVIQLQLQFQKAAPHLVHFGIVCKFNILQMQLKFSSKCFGTSVPDEG